jgi:hypothetical protein
MNLSFNDNEKGETCVPQPINSAALYTSRKRRLPSNYIPGEYTIICGRGKACFNSSGNRHLKSFVKKKLTSYSESQNKIHKSSIVSEILAEITQLSPDASFVKHEDGSWWELDDNFAREKIGCLFRDCLFTQYRSSTKAKQARKQKKNIVSSARFPKPAIYLDSSTSTRTNKFNPRMDYASSASPFPKLGLPIGKTQSPSSRTFPSSGALLSPEAVDSFAPVPLPERNCEEQYVATSSRVVFPGAAAKSFDGHQIDGHQMPFRRGERAGFSSSFLPVSLTSSTGKTSNQKYSSNSVLKRAYAVVTRNDQSAASRAATTISNDTPEDDISGVFKTDDLPDSFEDPFEDEI